MESPEFSNPIKSETPKLVLPDDKELVAKLERKLTEYKKRLEEQKEIADDGWTAKERVAELTSETRHKIAVLEELLTNKVIDTHELSRRLKQEDKFYSVRYFERACAVINDYVTTGGEQSSGGTGLK